MHKLKYNADWLDFLCDDGLMSLAEIAGARERGEVGGSSLLPPVKKFGKFLFQGERIDVRDVGAREALRTRQEGTDHKPYDFLVTLDPARRPGISVYIKRNHAGPSAHIGDVIGESAMKVLNTDGSLRPDFLDEMEKDREVVLLDDSLVMKFTIKGGEIVEQIQSRQQDLTNYSIRKYSLRDGKPIASEERQIGASPPCRPL